ncbi:hypothetical protein QAD02_005136 [Eretmocerus hayati]|uniref:Uncharacterized protein n=1 Tax=Eretmocerus hayati TaxID=131215 RepID=A0ACC2NRZ8_9HYME|nr:hypothetical protein QAD02_005136 [Eretmocerus hayati]
MSPSVKNTDKDGFGKLIWAVFHGKKELIESLLEKNVPVNNPADLDQHFRSPLHSAIYAGDPVIVKKLLDKGASVNVSNKNGETALMIAAKFGKYEIVDILLSDKRLKNRSNTEGFSHLHIACMRNRVDVVEKLLENKKDIHASVERSSLRWAGYTPLHFAVRYECVDTVEFLLNAGANFTIPNSKTLTPLHLADMVRNVEIIDMILKAHRRVVRNPVNSEGLSHFHIACTRNNPEPVKCFIRNSACLLARVNESSSNWARFTAIDFAIYYDCIDIVKLLLMEGGRQIFPSVDLERITKVYQTGNSQLINLYLLRDEMIEENTKKIQRIPRLHSSCMYSDLQTIREILVEAPSEIDKMTLDGSTPLHLAIERGEHSIAEFLLNQGADYHVQNADGKTSLHLAFEHDMDPIVQTILNNLIDMREDIIDDDGISHLHIACMADDIAAVARLIEIGANVNQSVNLDSPFSPGFTSLHFAAEYRSARMIRTLLENGASYSATDKNNLSAYDVCLYNCRDLDHSSNGIEFDAMRSILRFHLEKKDNSFNDRGFSLLHLFDYNAPNNTEAFRNLVDEFRGDVNKSIPKMDTPLDGYTPLHFAMANGDTFHVQLLVDMGADLISVAANGATPFHLTFNRFIIPEISMNISDFVKMQHNPMSPKGYSLFHIACAAGNLDWIKYFLDHGVDPNTRTKVEGYEFDDMTPLHVAAKTQGGSKLQVMNMLLEYGADATIRDDHLNTPLHHMIGYIETECIDLLVSHGVDVNSRDVGNETALLAICKNSFWFMEEGLSEKIVSLLNHGADVNLENEEGVTPLSYAGNLINVTHDNFTPCILILMKHVVKLKEMNLYISETNEEAYSNLLQVIPVDTRPLLSSFSLQCKEELALTKSIRLDNYTSLHEFLYKDLNGLAAMSENHEIQKMINSDYLTKNFPIYGYILKSIITAQLIKGQERRPLLAKSEKVLELLMKICLPRLCSEKILGALTNADLKNLISTRDII